MRIERLWIRGFRSYDHAEVALSEGTCVVVGPNGAGKSNILEAICYAGTLSSFRGAPTEAMIARGSDSAIVRASFDDAGRETLVEAEMNRSGRNRVMLNRQRLPRTAELVREVAMTVFAPGDLELIKGGPGIRRAMIDDLLVAIDHRNDPVRSEFERALRQRNALLKNLHGRLDPDAERTLDVWDAKVTSAGERLSARRVALIESLGPLVAEAYSEISGTRDSVTIDYLASWSDVGLAAALAASRSDDLRRGLTLVGPHRDEISIELATMSSRTHASQGEQRTLALALRIAGHRLLADVRASTPILLLDDVFSELDDHRAAALLESLPPGQRILTTATDAPSSVKVDQVVTIGPGGPSHSVSAAWSAIASSHVPR